MPRFEYALSTAETLRSSGVVVSNDFADALHTIQENAAISNGDVLMLGVPGFPPVRYECVGLEVDTEGWTPVWRAMRRAA
jgi:hypothetical protein